MIALFFLVAPLLTIASLAGYGAALKAGFGRRGQSGNFFEAAFWGLFLVSAAVLAANFFAGIGTAPGLYVLAAGLVLFAIFQARGAFDLPPLVLLATFVAAAVFLIRSGTQLPFDAGLYYIPAMNWTAQQPAPLGLVNLEGRLGFDSAWLLFEAALRTGRITGWSHLVVAEIALRSLAIGWMAQQFLTECVKGWTAKALFLLASLVVLSAYLLLRFASPSTTDLPANLVAFCAWVTFAGLVLNEDEGRSSAQFSLLVMLVILAITFKLAVAPISLLPVWLSVRRHAHGALWRSQGGILCLVAIYGGLWLARNFVLSGCLVFPVGATCFPVSWSGLHLAGPMAAVVRGYARHPAIGMPSVYGLFDMAWLPSWFSSFGHAVEFWLMLLSIGTALTVMAFPARVGRSNSSVSALVWPSLFCAVIGLALWFFAAPNPRFSWCFFVMLGVTLIFRALSRHDFARWKWVVPPVTGKKAVVCAIPLLLAVMAIQLYRGMGWIQAPQPSFRQVAIPENWRLTMPLSGGQCWELFPCTPYDLGDVSAVPWHGRLLFRANLGDRHS